ncbi:uncharacterized protein EI90DRAFT_3034650 [Cantharellus anzutake]|uniref:uncharacterized protein n=1 Tax=Cantharellus anzutake TaxID=1750568 RepID=UPI001902CDDC|nr:uncharacterized protein EI90DRAFT_3034650 [Cantharellus anzutake]KAF8341624.1 hypothetical protein EI90DRAFT_3034650 [Cantharellus anzutake]
MKLFFTIVLVVTSALVLRASSIPTLGPSSNHVLAEYELAVEAKQSSSSPSSWSHAHGPAPAPAHHRHSPKKYRGTHSAHVRRVDERKIDVRRDITPGRFTLHDTQRTKRRVDHTLKP